MAGTNHTYLMLHSARSQSKYIESLVASRSTIMTTVRCWLLATLTARFRSLAPCILGTHTTCSNPPSSATYYNWLEGFVSTTIVEEVVDVLVHILHHHQRCRSTAAAWVSHSIARRSFLLFLAQFSCRSAPSTYAVHHPLVLLFLKTKRQLISKNRPRRERPPPLLFPDSRSRPQLPRWSDLLLRVLQ